MRAKDVVYAGILITALFVLAHNGTGPMLGSLDVYLFFAINQDMQNPVVNSMGEIAYNIGYDSIKILRYILLVGSGVLILSIVRNNKELRKLVMILFIALIISVAINDSIKSIFGISRPYIYLNNVHVYDGSWFNSDKVLSMHVDKRDSFPSGHATLTFTVLGVLWIYKRLRIPFLAFLFLIMFLIVYVGQHYVSDIIAGGVIGFSIGYFAHKIVTSAVSYIWMISAILPTRKILAGKGSTSAAASWGHVNPFYEFQLVQSYGRDGKMAVNNREDQEIAILSLHLLQICMGIRQYTPRAKSII